MNILTFDIEEWYLCRNKSIIPKLDVMLNEVLNLLDERKLQATFFCVGAIVRECPNVIKQIFERGHEVACQSDKHDWLYLFNREELQEDTHRAIDSIEQLIGKKVKGYRAPAFSIAENNKWALEILKENGIEYDCSIFPAIRDYGGFPSFAEHKPTIIKYNGIEIKEFPISTTKIFGKDIVFSGGGYFRLFPLAFIKKIVERNDYNMFYFHIGDLINERYKFLNKKEYEKYFKEEGTFFNRTKRYFKSNIGTGEALNKLKKLLSLCKYENVSSANELIEWQKQNIIQL